MPVRIALRDTYGKPDNDLTKSVASLSTDLGLEADLHIDWVAVWEGLKAPFKNEPQVYLPHLWLMNSSLGRPDLISRKLVSRDSSKL